MRLYRDGELAVAASAAVRACLAGSRWQRRLAYADQQGAGVQVRSVKRVDHACAAFAHGPSYHDPLAAPNVGRTVCMRCATLTGSHGSRR